MNPQDFNDEKTVCGVSLRDYFAAKAMQGIFAGTLTLDAIWTKEVIATTAYRVADAMLEARKK
jgi:hypothetical protein